MAFQINFVKVVKIVESIFISDLKENRRSYTTFNPRLCVDVLED